MKDFRSKKMKSILILFIISTVLSANPKDYSKDVASLDSIIHALYDVISGEKGEARDWERFLYLFHNSGTLRSVGKTKEGKVDTRAMTPEEYIKRAEPFWLGMAFSKGRSVGGRNHTAISPTCSPLMTAGIPPVNQNHLLEGSIVSS